MGIGVSIFLIAVGAVLAFAVEYEAAGLDIQVVGWILLAVGAGGILLSLLFWSSWGGVGRREVVEERPSTRRETVVREDV
jgi:Domain of unknown function (DUF6458)